MNRICWKKRTSNYLELPLWYGSDAPYYYYEVDFHERDRRFELTSDLCIMDDEYYFLRGSLEIPIVDRDDKFTWDVWISLTKKNYEKVIKERSNKGRETSIAYSGWLSTTIPVYPQTLNLQVNIHIREREYRPFIELKPSQHPLFFEQSNGVNFDRIKEIHQNMQYYNTVNLLQSF